MNNDKNPTNRDNSVVNNDESRSLNESEKLDIAENNFENKEPALSENNNAANAPLNAVDEDIDALENGPQKNPGSSGAFPVGAFDTSKPRVV